MSYPDAISFLYSLQKYGIKLGLDKMQAIVEHLGNPHAAFRSIHIAGTNGKGSIAAIAASILEAHGYRVGLFTSPHLVSFTERIRINGAQITESGVVRLTEALRPELAVLKSDMPVPTFFEFVTAMAFLYFAQNKVDWAVVEVGMGGRLDATNVITPEVSVITKIGYDHTMFLGETLSAIAGEKAGIIKPHIPVVVAPQAEEAEHVILKKAEENDAPLFIYGKDFEGVLTHSSVEGITFDYRENDFTIPDLFLPLAGEHQLINASVAIKAARCALQSSRAVVRKRGSAEARKEKNTSSLTLKTDTDTLFQISVIKEGVARTRWPGRLEVVSKDPFIILDGAHNPDAAITLAEFIKKHFGGCKVILILGAMADKDVKGIIEPLLPLATHVILTAPHYERAASVEKLEEYANALGATNAETAVTVKGAIERAKKIYSCSASSLIVITGSFYLIGEAKEILGEKAVLGDLREKL